MFKSIRKLIGRSGNIHSLAGNILFAVFSMAMFLILVRVLDKDLYGRWVIFITTVSLLDMLRVGLTGTGAIRSISTSSGIEQYRNIAASYHLGILTIVVISCLFLPTYFLLHPYLKDSYYLPVLLYYPLLSFANLPHLQATNYCQGIINFKRVMIIRGLLGFIKLLFLVGYVFLFKATLSNIILIYISGDLLVSILVVLLKWDGNRFLKYYHKPSMINLFNFGKYSTASFVGSNLLRSSDTIIISLSSVMGAQAVAVYTIPLKVVELVEIPLRSFTAIAYPKLSAALVKGKEEFIHVLSMYLSFTSLFLIPIILPILLFPHFILHFLGGSAYSDSIMIQQKILYVIIIYILLLPFDRYSGMALFALNKPKLNFYKIMTMLFINILFDSIAVFIFHSLILVSLASVMFTLPGLLNGWYYIKKDTSPYFNKIFSNYLKNLAHLFYSIRLFIRANFKINL